MRGVAACTPRTDDTAANELRRGNGSEPDSIDPQLARMEAAMTILRDSYEGLVSMGADGSPVPGVAKGWEISADGRRYTFRLRPAARVFSTIEERASHLATFIDGYARFAKLPRPRPEAVAWSTLLAGLTNSLAFRVVEPLPARPGWVDAAQIEQVLIQPGQERD